MKGKKKKKKRPAETASLLTRLMRGGKSAEKGKRQPKKASNGTAGNGAPQAAAAAEESSKPKTPLDHSIGEIKHMMAVGENDPERLAMLLSKLLGSEKQKRQEDQQAFDRMVIDIVDKDKQTGASD